MSDLEFDKVIIFIESLKADYKNDVLTSYKHVINAIDNDSDFIMTTSFLNLSMDLILKKKYRILIQLDVSDDEIVGYTDKIGNSEYNKTLSASRANFVKDVITKAGVNASRLTVAGQGEDTSVDASSADARRLVRKVIFKLK